MSLLSRSYHNIFDFLHGVVVVDAHVEVIRCDRDPVLFWYENRRTDGILVDLKRLNDGLRVT